MFRPVLVAFVASLVALPVVAAQSPLVQGSLVVTMSAPERGVEPEGRALEISILLEAACDLAYAGQPLSVAWSVTKAPAWASVVIDPPTDSGGLSRCEGGPSGVLRFPALARVTASANAPAFGYEALEVEAAVTHPVSGEWSARGTVPVFATFYSILDVQAPVRQLPGGEGLGAAFPLRFTNFGNANTKVVFSVASDDGVAVDLPEPLVLQSKQAGGHAITEDVLVVAHPERASDRPMSFLLRWSSAYALDPAMVGDSGEIELIVLPGRGTAGLAALAQSPPEDDARSVPGLGAIGAAVALVGAALVLRRRR